MKKSELINLLNAVIENNNFLQTCFVNGPSRASYKYLSDFCHDLIISIENDDESNIIRKYT